MLCCIVLVVLLNHRNEFHFIHSHHFQYLSLNSLTDTGPEQKVRAHDSLCLRFNVLMGLCVQVEAVSGGFFSREPSVSLALKLTTKGTFRTSKTDFS